MPRKARTYFETWRREAGLTQARAAEILGLSESYVKSLDAGISRTSGEPAIPSKPVRKLMTAYIEGGYEFEPYPSKKSSRNA